METKRDHFFIVIMVKRESRIFWLIEVISLQYLPQEFRKFFFRKKICLNVGGIVKVIHPKYCKQYSNALAHELSFVCFSLISQKSIHMYTVI